MSREGPPGRLTPARHQVLDDLLDKALQREESERQEFIDRCTRKAPRLGAWLVRLVQASASPTLFIEGAGQRLMGSAASQADTTPKTLPQGTRLGPWRLLEPVGHGGMGQVYRAERADGAFEMQVAVKLILRAHPGLSEALERERRLLARLDDPAIARLLDGGLTDDGQPYLVMEWVSGQDLTDWIRQPGRSIGQCIRLFRHVVRALASAHRGLVVHGDIKPPNIRITADGTVKLLDFGLARIQSEEDRKADTLALTPGFSAPELLAGELPSVASDIYSLGALLAWLMDADPRDRAFDPAQGRWCHHPRGRDLAAIARQAMANAAAARYGSTEALLADLERLDAGWPVRARPVGPVSRTVLWLRRNRLPATVGALVVLGIVAGTGHALWQAEQTRLEAERALSASRHAEAVNEFLVSLFEHADPFAAEGEIVTARDLLEQGIERIGMLDESPGFQLEMLRVLARVSSSLGHYTTAEELLEQAWQIAAGGVGIPDRIRASVLSELGEVVEDQGDNERALEMHDRALEIRPRSDRALHAELMMRRAGPLIALDRYDEAGVELEQARAIQESLQGQRVALARTLNAQGALYTALDKHEESLAVFEKALAIIREELGDYHDATLTLFGNVANARGALGDRAGAVRDYEELLEIRRRLLGEAHPDVAIALHQIGIMHLHDNRPEAAEPVLREAVEIREQALPADHPGLYRSQNALAGVLRETGDLDVAETMVLRALDGSREVNGHRHLQSASILAHLAVLRMDQGDLESSRELHEEALAIRRELVGDVHGHVANSYRGLARLHLEADEPEVAAEWIERAMATYAELYADDDHPEIEQTRELQEKIEQARSHQ